jgi:hypothetical protein
VQPTRETSLSASLGIAALIRPRFFYTFPLPLFIHF